jgi:hypothetical protein
MEDETMSITSGFTELNEEHIKGPRVGHLENNLEMDDDILMPGPSTRHLRHQPPEHKQALSDENRIAAEKSSSISPEENGWASPQADTEPKNVSLEQETPNGTPNGTLNGTPNAETPQSSLDNVPTGKRRKVCNESPVYSERKRRAFPDEQPKSESTAQEQENQNGLRIENISKATNDHEPPKTAKRKHNKTLARWSNGIPNASAPTDPESPVSATELNAQNGTPNGDAADSSIVEHVPKAAKRTRTRNRAVPPEQEVQVSFATNSDQQLAASGSIQDCTPGVDALQSSDLDDGPVKFKRKYNSRQSQPVVNETPASRPKRSTRGKLPTRYKDGDSDSNKMIHGSESKEATPFKSAKDASSLQKSTSRIKVSEIEDSTALVNSALAGTPDGDFKEDKHESENEVSETVDASPVPEMDATIATAQKPHRKYAKQHTAVKRAAETNSTTSEQREDELQRTPTTQPSIKSPGGKSTAVTKSSKKSPPSDNKLDGERYQILPPKPSAEKSAKKGAAIGKSSNVASARNDEDDEERQRDPLPQPPTKKPQRKRTATKNAAQEIPTTDDEDEEEPSRDQTPELSTKKQAKKSTTVKKRIKPTQITHSDGEEVNVFAPSSRPSAKKATKKGTGTKKRTKAIKLSDDSEESVGEEEASSPQSAPASSKKPRAKPVATKRKSAGRQSKVWDPVSVITDTKSPLTKVNLMV